MERSLTRALITGISGSGGSYLADYLAEHRPEVEIHGLSRWRTARMPPGPPSPGLARATLHECDLLDLGSILRALDRARPDVIFHLASHANVRAGFDIPLAVIQNNVMGTANLLEAVRLSRQDPLVQLCSTSEVYGQVPPERVPIDEACPLAPVSPYAVSKAAQDLLGFSYHKSFGVRVVRTRMFAYVNPRRLDLFATAFALQVARVEAGQATELVHGNLDSVRTMVDVRDAMSAYVAAAERGVPGEVYNIGGTTVIKVGEVLERLVALARVPVPTRVDPALLRPADVTLQIPNVTKFRQATGWVPTHGFDESLTLLLDTCRAIVAGR